MKKLSLIMAMVLIATIGGVYATWIYPEDDIKAEITTTKAIETAVSDGAKGVITINENNIMFTYDQIKSTDPGYIQPTDPNYVANKTDYTAVLRFTGKVDLTLTAKENSNLYNQDSYTMVYHLSTTIADSKPAVDGVNNEIININVSTQKTVNFTKESAGVFKATINATDLQDLISIPTIYAENHTKWSELRDKINLLGTITVNVVEQTSTVIAG